jgi:hypothetical protein
MNRLEKKDKPIKIPVPELKKSVMSASWTIKVGKSCKKEFVEKRE